MINEDDKTGIFLIMVKCLSLNIGAYILTNYDKVLGAFLSVCSITYVLIKIYKELKKPKDENISKRNRSN